MDGFKNHAHSDPIPVHVGFALCGPLVTKTTGRRSKAGTSALAISVTGVQPLTQRFCFWLILQTDTQVWKCATLFQTVKDRQEAVCPSGSLEKREQIMHVCVRPGFHAGDIQGWMVLCGGAVLGIVGHLAASLEPTRWMAALPSPQL